MSSYAKRSKASARSRTGRSKRSSALTSRPPGKVCSKAIIERRRSSGCDEVSEKLEALKSLIIPASTTASGHAKGQQIVADQLFEETADYILRLRAQVVVLQQLIQLYGSSSDNSENENAVDVNAVL